MHSVAHSLARSLARRMSSCPRVSITAAAADLIDVSGNLYWGMELVIVRPLTLHVAFLFMVLYAMGLGSRR